MKNLVIYILLIFTLFSCKAKPEKTQEIDLSGTWQFQYKGNWYEANVPGTIHTDLLANDLISDPFWENNEDSLQWIERENWKYKRKFVIEKEMLSRQNIDIVFEGLDTYAKVLINGKKVISANNMFRTWRRNIKPFVNEGENTIEVNFISPIIENQTKVEKYPHRLPSGNETVEIKVSSFTRKAAYHFGWDWGPRFVGCGIWRNVKIESWDKGHINTVYVQTKSLSKERATLEIEINVEITDNEKKKYTIEVNNQKQYFWLTKGKHILPFLFTINQPKLWWPNGLGEAYLYDLQITLLQDHKILDQKHQKTGLRTIELVNEVDSIGRSFYFIVNGEPVFMKGANYIPQDIFSANFSRERYKSLIENVKNSNMNMLRVWGGGIYEDDIFYELCDENGILVWQDFMFAGSLYPDTPTFLKNIKEEVKDNIIRLRNHPCLALWCGNNEIEVAWNNWGWQNQYGYNTQDSTDIWNNYKRIFEQIIPEQINLLDKSRAYVSTSPMSNWGTAENFNHSSMHYWGVWHGKEAIEKYKSNVGRFMVEYGFQSFPKLDVINKFASKSNQHLMSSTMLNRQKSYIGNGLIEEHIKRWYGRSEDFEDFIDKNLDLQKEALKMAIKSHRRRKPHCMGTLFWQLNDCWTGPSWSVIDYDGNNKPAMDMVKEYFKPIIVVAEEQNDSMAFYIVSDLLDATNVRLDIVSNLETGKKIWEIEKDYSIKSNSSEMVLKIPMNRVLKGQLKKDVGLQLKLKQGTEIIFMDDFIFAPDYK